MRLILGNYYASLCIQVSLENDPSDEGSEPVGSRPNTV